MSASLLYGPPGTGKTLLAKALANECGVNFIAVDGPETVSPSGSASPKKACGTIFRIARQVAPTVIFFDQLDSITPVRGAHDGSMTTERVVNQLLAELDGVEQLSRVIVVGATNRIDLVDPSILRPGRFGMHIHVPLPDAVARHEILRIHLGSAASGSNTDLEAMIETLVAKTENFSGARLRHVCHEAKRLAIRAHGFTHAAHPTLAHAIEALETDLSDQTKGVTDNG